jgi:hypothetical protein
MQATAIPGAGDVQIVEFRAKPDGMTKLGTRALVLADAIAVLVGTAGAFIFRAGVRSYDSLAPDHLASLILPALPFVLTVCLVALWSAGAYGPRRADLGVLDLAGALAWAASVLAFIAFYWSFGPETPLLVVVAGYVLTLLSLLTVRAYLAPRLQRWPAFRRST